MTNVICPECEKNFQVDGVSKWIYKGFFHRKRLLFCSWGCFDSYRNRYEAEKEASKKKKVRGRYGKMIEVDVAEKK